jgi:23S rRNA (guanosine2251-2'-O)-methyltransferase
MIHTIYIVLENIRSAQNVGAIFRTAEAIGVSCIALVGYTPTPTDRFGREVGRIAKAALGAHAMVPWRHFETIEECIEFLKQEGCEVVCVERVDHATDYKKYAPGVKTALIFGNEIDGVSLYARQRADHIISLPMQGKKESLNVATTMGIVVYRLFDC